jgi:GT2 family glycosyltransferase
VSTVSNLRPDVSIIIVNWNTRQMLAECLASLYASIAGATYDVWVVDNASSDGSVEMLRGEFPAVNVIANDRNVGFARANNQGIAATAGRCVLLFNSDALLTPGALEALLAVANGNPRAGIIGGCLLNPDGTFQASYTDFPSLWQEFLILTGLGRLLRGPWFPSHGPHAGEAPRLVHYVEGACMLVRREAIQAAGGLDEGYFMYAEEVDWCYAMRRHGWQVWYQPQARITHFGGGSSRQRRPEREADMYRSRVRFFRKHYGGAAAAALKTLLYALTAVKIVFHRGLRLATGGRRGRPVVSLRALAASLREA